ncbi:probable serine/threonine-protein kinase PknJ at C-terminar half [Coccomyxa sp. Obi]|nr:probable serine/threonine-protein kinase PknJ at C-terminar half [Coccomyxa sp. Obi]
MASNKPSSGGSKLKFFSKMTSFVCGGKPHVRLSDDERETEAVYLQTRTPTPGILKTENQAHVHLNALSNNEIEAELDASNVLPSAPLGAVTTSTPQSPPPSQLQCLTKQLEDERAHSAKLQDQVTTLTANLKEKESQEAAAHFADRTVLRAALREADAEKAAVVATYERVLGKQAASAEMAQEDMLRDALDTFEGEKIQLAKEYEDRLVVARAAGAAVLRGALQSIEAAVAEMAEARGVQQELLKHFLERIGEKGRELQAAKKEAELRSHQFRRALRRQLRAEETLKATTKSLSDANDSMEALRESISYYQEQLQRRTHENTQLPIFSEVDCPIVAHIGAGACASVDRHRMEFAVKKPKDAAEAEWLRREGEIMACLQHPNIVRALGWVQPQDGGHWGLAMAYEDGGNLKDFIRWAYSSTAPGWDPRGRVGLSIVDELAAGLQYAHSQNKVHSDFKPDNILVRGSGNSMRPIIADWGCAYDVREEGIKWRGSVGFGRPGGAIDARLLGPDDDIRALCAVTFELFTGLDIFELLHERLREKYEDGDPSWKRNINMACDEFGLNKENLVHRMLVAEACGAVSVTEEDVAHLLVDPRMPNNTVRVIMSGLSKKGATGRLPMPSLADIREAIQQDLKRQQLLEYIGLYL